MISWLLMWIWAVLLSQTIQVQAQHSHSGHYGGASTGEWLQLGHPVSSGGLQVNFRVSASGSRFLKSVTPGEVELGFRLDWEDGKGPASGLEPFAWVARAPGTLESLDGEACHEAISRIARGGIASEEAIALNKMQILTLNQDNTLSIINPRVNLATANIQGVIPLGGKPLDALVDENRGLVFLLLEKATMPFGAGSGTGAPGAVGGRTEKGELATIDLHGNRVRNRLGLQGVPYRMWADPGKDLLWVTGRNGEVSLVESESLRLMKNFKWGGGPVNLSLDSSQTRVFLASPTQSEILVLDARRGDHIGKIQTRKAGVELAASAQTGLLYGMDPKGGGILVLDPSKLTELGFIPMAPGASFPKISPGGRFLLALFPQKRALAVVDLDRGLVVQRGKTGQEPEQLEFSEHYGYVLNRQSAYITIFRLADLGEGPELPVLEIPVGANPDNGIPVAGNLKKLAIMHGHGGALVAHAADRMVYHYMEGMMAPMSGLRLQTAPPVGMLIYHRRILEGPKPGEYRARLRLSEGGRYQVLFHLPSQGISACFELPVEGPWDLEKAPARKLSLVPKDDTYFLGSQGRVWVTFEIRDEITARAVTGLEDLKVMLFAPKGNWQWRALASEVQPGLYRAGVIFPRAGKYFLLVESRALGLSFGGLRHAVLQVEEGAPTENTFNREVNTH